MASHPTAADIDRLYQLPLEEFTAARNALAKEPGSDGAEIRRLQKPALAAWAVNQLFWRDANSYRALIAAAEDLRRAHASALKGQRPDLRAAGKAHEQAIEAALKSTVEILQQSGHPVTDTTRQAIATTLRALPGSETPGRLTEPLQPGGFEVLSGMPVVPRPVEKIRPGKPAPPPSRQTPERRPVAKRAVNARALARAKEEAAAAMRSLKEAEHTARREEFEAARAGREAEKANRAVAQAREALAEAQRVLADAEADEKQTAKAREAAERKGRAAAATLEAARERADAAQAALASLRE